MRPMRALEKAIDRAGGLAELARLIGTTPQVVNNWRLRRSVPAQRAKDIEKALKKAVTREELCPDVFGD
jgi:DNA-binding transcriptional regulator YdaS (Cro superfamily)